MRILLFFVAVLALFTSDLIHPSGASAADTVSQDETKFKESMALCRAEKRDDGTLYCVQAALDAGILYEAKCEAKDYAACLLYAESMVNTNVTRGDFVPIGVMLEESCNARHSHSCSYLGSLFARGWHGKSIFDEGQGLEIDFKNSFYFYDKGCTLGSAMGCYGLGLLHMNAEGVPQNLEEALNMFTITCDAGYGEDACTNRDAVKQMLAKQQEQNKGS
jgi:TPR repeat protein